MGACRSADPQVEPSPPAAVSVGDFGRFEGDVVARWLEDDRTMELLEHFRFVDCHGTDWPAPIGSVVDGASIPRFLWATAGSPFTGSYRKASVVHDVACDERLRPWQRVHRMFYDACRAGGMGSAPAKTMFWAVYHLGPTWSPDGQSFVPASELESLSQEQQLKVDEILQYIESTDPPLEEIESLVLE
jgi:hypothetical protein